MSTRRSVFLVVCALWLPGMAGAQTSRAARDLVLRRGFESPPPQAKLRCYWWWLNGNTTEETITHELTEMSLKGFGGLLLVDADGSSQAGNAEVPPGPTFASPAWTKLYVHALEVAAKLHLEVTLNITSGWNLGGPDVTPDEASKLLTWSRTTVDGEDFDGVLPAPASKNGFYRQIAVITYPLAHGASLPGQGGDKRAAIRQLRMKSAAAETGFSMPASEVLLGEATSAAGEEDTQLANIVDISKMVDGSGHLRWRKPSAGPWEILIIGYTDSDARVSTSSGAWQGLAIDYLDRSAFDTYWNHTVVPLLDAGKPYLRKSLVNLATDSWELGGTNWTGRFRTEFTKRRGYDPLAYLPIVSGRIINDRATSERFLNDFRRTIGDLITDHYDHFAERAKEYGLGIECESGGPHGAPMDALETFRSSAVPQTEYWAQSNEHRSTDEDRYFTKEAASAANIYGKTLAAEEGMTSIGPHWSESLATDLKPSFDQGLTEGMNRLVWHAFTSSPASFGLPGNEYFAGTHMNPRITWWEQSEPFFRYLNRSQFLLQQGHAVDDVLYFYGDEVPNFVRLKRDDPAHVLPGYDYDVTNEDALLRTLIVGSGGMSTPAGNRYHLLAMPQGRRLSVASLERIAAYVKQGGSIVGNGPIAPTGIVDATQARRFSELANAIWGDCVKPFHSYGEGTVFCGSDSRAALKQLHVVPDFEDTTGQLDYIHRAQGSTEIYFVRNTHASTVDALVRFRIAGLTPELWDAVDGSIVRQAHYSVEGGRTTLAVHLAPFGSTFIVFVRSNRTHVDEVLKDGKQFEAAEVTGNAHTGFTLKHAEPGNYTLHLSDGRDLRTSVSAPGILDLPPSQWTISYQADRGAPAGTRPVQEFDSWTLSSEPGVRFFSGTATYRTEVNLKRSLGARIFLSLTDLHEICTVRLNGKPAGTIWSMPYRLDVTDFISDGRNSLELEVTNLWPNRIIGDAQPSATVAYTKTNIRKYRASSPLFPSGLIGPVKMETLYETTK
jgi:hypothetical protein